MPEQKPILHATLTIDYTKHVETPARPSGDKTWTKYGVEQDIQDFINAGAENVSIMKHIENAGGLDKLRAAGLQDTDDVVIDRAMDIVQFNRMKKVIDLAMAKIQKEQAEKAKQEQSEQKDE